MSYVGRILRADPTTDGPPSVAVAEDGICPIETGPTQAEASGWFPVVPRSGPKQFLGSTNGSRYSSPLLPMPPPPTTTATPWASARSFYTPPRSLGDSPIVRNASRLGLASLLVVATRYYWHRLGRTTAWDEASQSVTVILRILQDHVARLLRPKEPPRQSATASSDEERVTSGAPVSPAAAPVPSPTVTRDTKDMSSFEHVQHVLLYWFGQYNMDQARHSLWMIPNGSEQQRGVDAQVTEQFQTILMSLADANGTLLHQWTNSYGYLGKVAAIVVLDQFSRHILRHSKGNDTTTHKDNMTVTHTQLREQREYDTMAFQICESLLQEHESELACGMVPHSMYLFAIMPLRHVSTIESVARVQTYVRNLEERTEQCDTMVRRFRQATNRRMAVLQDEQRRTQGKGQVAGAPATSQAGSTDHEYTEEDILECTHFQADLSASVKHPVHLAMTNFLESRRIRPHSPETATPVIVSLSGGVDSMVIVSVLSYLVKQCHYNLRIRAVHIDYANRPESASEAAYCQYYCSQILGNVELEVCRIDHVTRGVTARDEYESVSRQVRFDAYRRAIQQAAKETGAQLDDIGIFLGHHRGDLRENVLSNAHKGCGPIELSGMTSVSRNDGVTLFRPLLSLEKYSILDYAHLFGVAYFKDTTPHWSTRGKLRNKLLPLLEEIYGEGSMNNLSDLAVESDQCRDLLRSVLFGPFLEHVRHMPMGISFETDAWKDQGLFFWKFVLREALHSASIGMFSDKAVASFLERVQAKDRREGWLQCRKECGVYLQNDGRVYVLFAASFPWRKADRYDCQGRCLPVGTDHAVRVGPWRVEATIATGESDADHALRRKAVASMNDLMSGRITYYLQARTWLSDEDVLSVRPLVFQVLNKATRPEAWKHTDTKIQETLPLVGVDEKTAAAFKDPMGCGAFHVDVATGETKPNSLATVKVTLELENSLSP